MSFQTRILGRRTTVGFAAAALLLALTITLIPNGSSLGKTSQPRVPTPQQPHLHDAANVIDGSVHPEMIQDRDAFRLFFLAAATDANPTPDERERQRAMFSATRFSEEELGIASTVLADHKMQYEAAIQRYNDAVASAHSPEQLPDGKKLVAELDALVLAAQTKLESSVSGGSFRRLYAHVQGEKSKMSITAE